jgi:heptosyltransferase III
VQVLPTLPQGSRIALVRLRSMGDCVLTTPAIHMLKQWRPDLSIGVVVEPRFQDVYAGNPDIDRIFSPQRTCLLGWRPALVVNLHGGPRSAWITLASLARWRAGFGHYRFGALYNLRLPRAQQVLGEERTVHTAEHVVSAFLWLGLPVARIPSAKLVAPPAEELAIDLPARYAVIHPQATAPEKIWPAVHFLELAEHLRDQHRLEPVFIGANAQELAPFQQFRCLDGLPLRHMIGVVARASLFIGNDSGPAHVAAAFGRPGVVLFGGSDPVVWAPWQCPQLRQVIHTPVADIPVETVVAALPAISAPAEESRA